MRTISLHSKPTVKPSRLERNSVYSFVAGVLAWNVSHHIRQNAFRELSEDRADRSEDDHKAPDPLDSTLAVFDLVRRRSLSTDRHHGHNKIIQVMV